MGLLGEKLQQRDVAIGIVLSMSLGLGLLFLNFFTAYATQATTLLFGNILGIDAATVWTLLVLGIVAIAALAAIARPLLFASLQPELAEAKGVSLRLLSVLFLAIVALAVAECVQIVGVLLVFALMVGPAAAAQCVTTRFWSGIVLSVALALSEAWLGLVLAFTTDWPTSFWITALSTASIWSRCCRAACHGPIAPLPVRRRPVELRGDAVSGRRACTLDLSRLRRPRQPRRSGCRRPVRMLHCREQLGRKRAMSIRRLLAPLCLLTVLLAAGPAPAEKVLKVVPHADLTQLDPVFASIVITREYGLMIYEELFAWDSKLQPQPQMVDRWTTSPDGLTWRFTLRDGLKFHDGQDVTSQDVVPSLKRWMSRDLVGAKVQAALGSIDAIDARTFELRLQKPYPGLLFALGSAIGQIPVIMRAKDLDGDPTKPITTAIGSGPFRFNHGARISGALTVFDRNPAYVPRKEPADGLSGGRIAKVDRVEWRVMPDAATAALALQTGEMHIWEQPALDLVPSLMRNKDIRTQKLNDISNQTMLRPNSLYPPFNNPKARLALAYIINQSDVMAAGFGDPQFWKPCNAYFVCGAPYGTEAGTEDFQPGLRQGEATAGGGRLQGRGAGVSLDA